LAVPGSPEYTEWLDHIPQTLIPADSKPLFEIGSLPVCPQRMSGYLLPYASDAGPNGEGYSVLCGEDCHGFYAYDFDMPEGTPVLAARDGKLIDWCDYSDIRSYSYFGSSDDTCGSEPNYNNLGNRVVLNHGDGTAAVYLHLKQKWTIQDAYRPGGQTIKRGMVIGYSGKTGYSWPSPGCHPHLHFHVGKPGPPWGTGTNGWWSQPTICISFDDITGGVANPGRPYKSGNRMITSEEPIEQAPPGPTPTPEPCGMGCKVSKWLKRFIFGRIIKPAYGAESTESPGQGDFTPVQCQGDTCVDQAPSWGEGPPSMSSYRTEGERGDQPTESEGQSLKRNDDESLDHIRIHGVGTVTAEGIEDSQSELEIKTKYTEVTTSESHAIATGEEWETATTVDTTKAAQLTFRYCVTNNGTDAAIKIKNIDINIYIGADTTPITWRAPDLGRFDPGETHCYGIGGLVTVWLSLDHLRALDEGAPIYVVVESFDYGDESYYRDAEGKAVMVHLDDGVAHDGDEAIEPYLITTYGMDTYLEVLDRYFPMTIVNDTIASISTPEYTMIGNRKVISGWIEHPITDHSWWEAYINPDPLSPPATSFSGERVRGGEAILMTFQQDSDGDGYTDRAERSLGTDPTDPAFHPNPIVIAAIYTQTNGSQVNVQLAIQNNGDYDASDFEAVMYAPNDSVTVTDGYVGGGGRVRALERVVLGSRIGTPDLSNWQGTAKPLRGGQYLGSSEKTYTFTAVNGGNVGSANLTFTWSATGDGGSSFTLPSGYVPGTPMSISDGVQVAFSSGQVNGGDSFTIMAKPPLDTFSYTINHELYTEPVVVVSYNDPVGNHKFITSVEIDEIQSDLTPYQGDMIFEPKTSLNALKGFYRDRDNLSYLVVDNPSSHAIEGGHLFVEYVDQGGNKAAEHVIEHDFQPGRNVILDTWSTSELAPPFQNSNQYTLLAMATDYQGTIVDSDVQQMDLITPTARSPVLKTSGLTWNVGTIYWPESYGTLGSLIGGSHTGGVVKSSAGYTLYGVAGQPSETHLMTSTNYRLSPGYWATVKRLQAQLQGPAQYQAETATAPQAALDSRSSLRFPSETFTLANVGLSELQFVVDSLSSDLAVYDPAEYALPAGTFATFDVILDPDNLAIGPFTRAITIPTNDPTNPVVDITITGIVEPSEAPVFVYDSPNAPLQKVVHVNGVRDAGDTMTFEHGITDSDDLHPLFVYAGDGAERLCVGTEVDADEGCISRKDSASVDLTLPDSTSDRRDYEIYFGYKGEYSPGDHLYYVRLPQAHYGLATMDLFLSDALTTTLDLSLDVGDDGSIDWTFSGDVGGYSQNTAYVTDFSSDLNAYLDGVTPDPDGTVPVPFRVTMSINGTLFLTNLRTWPSQDFDLVIGPDDINASETTVAEGEVITITADVHNTGWGMVDDAIVSFYAGDPDSGGILLGNDYIPGIAAKGRETASLVWNTNGYTGTLQIYAVADHLDQIFESDETNNAASVAVTVLPAPIIFDVRTSNVRDGSFTVSWVTDIPTTCQVNHGPTTDRGIIAYDDRGPDTSAKTHYFTISDLLPQTTYYFDAVCSITVDDNGGSHYAVTTGPTLPPRASDTVWGLVLQSDGSTPAQGCIVYITLQDHDGQDSPGQAALMTTFTNENGAWSVNLGNARLEDLSDYFHYSLSGERLKVEAHCGIEETGCLMTDTANDTPAPDLILNVSQCYCQFRLPLVVGWNFLSLPVEPEIPLTAEGLCVDMSNQSCTILEVDRWHNDGWDGHVCGLPFNNFDIELGQGYFVKLEGPCTWCIDGVCVSSGVPLNLEIGWNSISIPHSGACNAETLCSEIQSQGVDAVEIDRWHYGGWEGNICGLALNDFDIEQGGGYFVKAASGGIVTPDCPIVSAARREAAKPDAPPQPKAQADVSVSGLRVTNVRDGSLTVSWITDSPAMGYVNFGSTTALGSTAYDDRGHTTMDDTHHVTLSGLSPETTYYFDVVSDSTVDDNGGEHYSVTTGPTLGVPTPDTIYGQVFLADGVTPAQGAIIYVTLQDADGLGSSGQSAAMSAVVMKTGYWSANLGNARTSDLSALFEYSASGDEVILVAEGGRYGSSELIIDTEADSPAPVIRLPAGWYSYLPMIFKGMSVSTTQ
jgi:hypothetical protein